MNSPIPENRMNGLRKLTRDFLNYELANSRAVAFRMAKDCLEAPGLLERWIAFKDRLSAPHPRDDGAHLCSTWLDGKGWVVFSALDWRGGNLHWGDAVKVPGEMARPMLLAVLSEMPKAGVDVFEELRGRGWLRLENEAVNEDLLGDLFRLRFGDPEELHAWLEARRIPHKIERASDGPSEEEIEEWLFPSRALKKILAPFASENPMDANERAGLAPAEEAP